MNVFLRHIVPVIHLLVTKLLRQPIKILSMVLFLLPESMWCLSKSPWRPLMLRKNCLKCFGWRITVVPIQETCSTMLMNVFLCHIVPVIHILVTKLLSQPLKELPTYVTLKSTGETGDYFCSPKSHEGHCPETSTELNPKKGTSTPGPAVVMVCLTRTYFV